MLVLVNPADHHVTARPARLTERVLARLRTGSLDRRLADGVPADSEALLALHAQRLVQPRRRRSLARSLRRLLVESMRPAPQVARSASPIRRDRVRAAAPELTVLIDHLLAPVPVSARAVAQVRLLLSDAGSPLLRACSVEELRGQARRLALELDPLTGW
jgi:hypothetical protein